jgi:hypothetical protein
MDISMHETHTTQETRKRKAESQSIDPETATEANNNDNELVSNNNNNATSIGTEQPEPHNLYDHNIDVTNYVMPPLKPLGSEPVFTQESPALGIFMLCLAASVCVCVCEFVCVWRGILRHNLLASGLVLCVSLLTTVGYYLE